MAYFLSKTPGKEGDLLAVDWEQTGGGTRASSAEKDRFIREVKRERPGHRVLLYCNRAFWRTHDTSDYAGDGLWIADYVSVSKPRIEASWRIHQYTDDPWTRTSPTSTRSGPCATGPLPGNSLPGSRSVPAQGPDQAQS